MMEREKRNYIGGNMKIEYTILMALATLLIWAAQFFPV